MRHRGIKSRYATRKYDCEARPKYLQADERAYVLSSGVEDVEMAAETDEDEEDAVLDELGGECDACSREFYSTPNVTQTRMKTKTR